MSTIPSIAMIPSGYKANKVYSVLPTDGAADLTFARTSSANRVNSDNLIEEVATGVPRLDYTGGGCPSLLLEPQSTNLITYPLSFNNPYWTKSGASIQGDSSTAGVDILNPLDFTDGWVQNRGTVTNITTASFDADGDASITKSVLEIGKLYIIELVSDVDVIMYSGTTENTGQFIGQGNGTYTFNAETTNISLRTLTNGTATFTTLSVKEVQGFSAPSVDNPLEAYKLVEDTSIGVHRLQRNISVTSGVAYSKSVRIKKGANRYFYIGTTSFSDWDFSFIDLDNDTVVSTGSGVEIDITQLTDGWVTISASRTVPSTTTLTFCLGTSTSSSSTSFTGAGADSLFLFGAQLEQQSFATSLMLPNTEGSTVTRVAETASKTGLANYINGVEGVLYFNSSIYLDDGVLKKISLSSGSDDNAISISYDVALGNISFTVRVGGGATSTQITATSIIKTNNNKIAFKYKENNFSAFINGVKVGEDLVGGVFGIGVLNKISFDRGNAANIFYGKCKDLRVYKTALSDAELVTLTTI